MGTWLQLYKISHHQIQPTLPNVIVPTVLTCQLLLPYDEGHGETLECRLLCCWVMWRTVRSLKKLQAQSTSEAEKQKQYYDRKASAISLETITWSWLKLMPTRGRGKWRTSGRRNHMKWNTKLLKKSLHTSWRTNRQDNHEHSTKTNLSHHSCRGDSPLCGHAS